MKAPLLYVLLALLWPLRVLAEPPVPLDRLGPSAALVGARSCRGECGEDCEAECRAILGVYAHRWEVMSRTRPELTFATVVRRYSSAVKRGAHHRRPWIFGLGPALDRPRGWPRALPWEGRHRDAWGRLLATAHAFLEGLVGSPCPTAEHFGNRTTDGRPRGHVRVECSVHTRNLFWRRRAGMR